MAGLGMASGGLVRRVGVAFEHHGHPQDHPVARPARNAFEPRDAWLARGARPCSGAADDRAAGVERRGRQHRHGRRGGHSRHRPARAHRFVRDAGGAARAGLHGAVELARALFPHGHYAGGWRGLRRVDVWIVDGAWRVRGRAGGERIGVRASGPQRHRAAARSVRHDVLRLGGHAARRARTSSAIPASWPWW